MPLPEGPVAKVPPPRNHRHLDRHLDGSHRQTQSNPNMIAPRADAEVHNEPVHPERKSDTDPTTVVRDAGDKA